MPTAALLVRRMKLPESCFNIWLPNAEQSRQTLSLLVPKKTLQMSERCVKIFVFSSLQDQEPLHGDEEDDWESTNRNQNQDIHYDTLDLLPNEYSYCT